MEPPFYRTSFSKHLHSLARSNYFSRSLDADDRQFLEYVKRHGTANGNLPNSNVVLLEELEFWHFPYSLAPGVERHVGRRPRPQETPEQFELRRARSNRWHAQRIIRENERAMAEAELARERREYEAAQVKRKMRETMSDAEWEAANPLHSAFGGIKGRHYVPQWRLDELGELNATDAKKAKREARRLAREKREQEAAELARRREEYIKQENERAIELRDAIIEEARKTVQRVTQLENEWKATSQANYSVETLQMAILTLLNSTPGQVWTTDEMLRSIGGCTRAFLDECLDSMIRQGKLRKMDKP